MALPHRVSQTRIKHSQIIVGNCIVGVDGNGFVQLLNGLRHVLLADQLVRFLEFLAGTVRDTESGGRHKGTARQVVTAIQIIRRLHLDLEFRRATGRHLHTARVGIRNIPARDIHAVRALGQVEEVYFAPVVGSAFGYRARPTRQLDVSRWLTATIPKRNPHSHSADDVAVIDLRGN